MSLFSWIKSGPKVLDEAIDAAKRTGDALVFTDEEKSQANQAYLEWYTKYLAATQPQNTARRSIAVMVVGLWAILVLMIAVLYVGGWQDKATQLYGILNNDVTPPFMLLMAFYFGAQLLREWGSKK